MSPLWILIGFFGTVLIAVTAAGYFWVMRPAAAPSPGSGNGSSPAAATAQGSDPLLGLFERLGRLAPASRADVENLRKRLVAAGYRSPSAVPVFFGMRYAAMLLLGLLTAWIAWQNDVSATSGPFAVVSAAAFGYLFADRSLSSRIQARRGRLAPALPDALDLMVLTLEAGHSLDQALVDCSLQLKRLYPDLSAEFALVHLELRAGTSRASALRNLAERTGEPELRKLANVLIQSDRFGTSLAPALRTHARYLRLRRKQRAEETARKIGVKLIFPIFFLIFPCMLLVTVGPALLQLFTQLIPMLTSP